MSATVALARAERPAQKALEKASAALSRTPWGDPDLQGVWTSGPMSEVPFERAAELGTRALLSEQEFAARVAANRRWSRRS